MPQLVAVHTRPEPLGVGAEVDHPEALAVPVEPQVAEHRKHEIARPAADRDERGRAPRSEEHTSELQSPCNLVCRLLLEKKKKKQQSDSLRILVCSFLHKKQQSYVWQI